jgi:hypothetical protein
LPGNLLELVREGTIQNFFAETHHTIDITIGEFRIQSNYRRVSKEFRWK